MGAFFKRFAVKFIEVVGAGIATALSGYLLAHFSGYWSPRAGAPPVVQVGPSLPNISSVPNMSSVPKSERGPSASASASEPVNSKPPARSSTKGSQTNNQTAAAHKPVAADIATSDSKPRDAEPSDAKSVEAQVRAALANVDSGRPAPSDAAAPKPELTTAVAPAPAITVTPAPAAPAPSGAQPPQKPADASGGASSAATVPPVAEVLPQPQQQAPGEPMPLTPVEIKSLPVAAVEPAPAVEPSSVKKETRRSAQADGSESAQDDKSLFGAIKKIPDFFRAAAPASDTDAPRPPRPVGGD